ncbi:hypothetical protein ACHAWC_004911 [Mediolabrus comicus]
MSNNNNNSKPPASHSLVEPPPSTSGGIDSSADVTLMSKVPSKSDDADSSVDVRSKVGSKLSSITDFVNDNLIIIRYATFSTVFILGAYGIANTPLFYRYKNLNDIPSKVFTKRKWIHGRIVGLLERESRPTLSMSRSFEHWKDTSASATAIDDDNLTKEQQQQPITILFRHSSPMERLLTESAMERVLKFTSASGKTSSAASGLLYSASNTQRNLLPVELAGVVSSATSTVSSFMSTNLTKVSSKSPSSSQTQEELQSLIEKKARVSLQMLALRKENTSSSTTEENKMHSAICHLSYRQPKQWFNNTNLELELVKRGQALVNPDGLVIPTKDSGATTTLIDFNPTVKQLQQDSTFISQLEEAEFAAFQSKAGVWSCKQMRELLRREYVEEEEYLHNSWWSRMKRGVYWLLGR